jgi:hypothetical protein
MFHPLLPADAENRADRRECRPDLFRPADCDQVAGADPAEFPGRDPAVFQNGYTVHPAFLSQKPLIANFEVFGKIVVA